MVPGYRYGQSAAGKRIEAAGRAFQAERARKAQEALQPVPEPPKPDPVELERGPLARLAMATCRQIIGEVAAKHGLSVSDLESPARNKRVSVPRQEAMYRCVLETDLALSRIGQAFGGRDHSTIGYGVMHHCFANDLATPRGMNWHGSKSWRWNKRRA